MKKAKFFCAKCGLYVEGERFAEKPPACDRHGTMLWHHDIE